MKSQCSTISHHSSSKVAHHIQQGKLSFENFITDTWGNLHLQVMKFLYKQLATLIHGRIEPAGSVNVYKTDSTTLSNGRLPHSLLLPNGYFMRVQQCFPCIMMAFTIAVISIIVSTSLLPAKRQYEISAFPFSIQSCSPVSVITVEKFQLQ